MQATTVQIKITPFAGVAQPMLLLCQPLRAAINVGTAQTDIFVIHIQVDEYIWLGDALPHVGYIGMFLGGMAGFVASRFERFSEAAFARRAGANDGDA